MWVIKKKIKTPGRTSNYRPYSKWMSDKMTVATVSISVLYDRKYGYTVFSAAISLTEYGGTPPVVPILPIHARIYPSYCF